MSRKTTGPFPAARTEHLIIEEVGPETIVYDEHTGQAHHLSPLAAVVFARSDGGTSVTQLAELARSGLGEPVDEGHIKVALAHLDELGLLAASPSTISRRTMLRRTGAAAGVAFATPVITSIMTPAFAQASPRRSCPNSICASQSDGDDFCACTNDCPEQLSEPDDAEKCFKTGPAVGPYHDSCECLDCQQLTDAGRPDLCPPTPYEPCPPGSAPRPGTPGPGGCTDPNKFLDGRCLRVGGDTSEC